ncbi:MAG: hypothetical protein KY455_10075 [Euryarchaeota archaeon]|nr:hypothetical protein [Euryarchaeota archaeon]
MSLNKQPNWIVLGVAALAIILGIFVLTLNWATAEVSFGGFNTDIDYTMFGQELGGEDQGWYDSDADEADGIGLIRAGIPIIVVGLVALLAGTVLTAIPPSVLNKQRLLSGGVLIGAGIVLLVGTILFTIGISSALGDVADGSNGAFDWNISAGMIFAYIVSVVSIGAGVLAFVMKSGPQIRIAEDAPQKA